MPPLRFVFTAEQDRILRDAYAFGTTKPRLTEALADAVRRIGYPRYILKSRAQRLGLTQDKRKPWTQSELDLLREYSGVRSVKWIARRLQRGYESVAAQMERHRISCRVTEGYTHEDVMALFGVSQPTVARWIGSGALKLHGAHVGSGRITEASVRSLIFSRPELYSLRRVDEPLFKSIVFSAAPVFLGPRIVTREPVDSPALGLAV
jgi:hypothetical protein